LPTVGYVDGWRSGLNRSDGGAAGELAGTRSSQVRSTAARGFMNGLWWWNHPDRLLVGGALGTDDVSAAVVAQAVSGGAWVLGDDLNDLEPDRAAVALNGQIMALSGQTVTPVDPLGFVSEFDAALDPGSQPGGEQGPLTWVFATGHTALLNVGTGDVVVDGPGGVELITGAKAAAGPRTLSPGSGEIWR
jgi:hypothetical protein